MKLSRKIIILGWYQALPVAAMFCPIWMKWLFVVEDLINIIHELKVGDTSHNHHGEFNYNSYIKISVWDDLYHIVTSYLHKCHWNE